MKNNRNKGMAKMEMIIAAVILAVVVIGVLIAIKLVSGGGSDTDVAQSQDEKTAQGIYTKISHYVSEADLGIIYNSGLNTLYIVNRSGYQVIQYDTAAGALYVNDVVEYSNPNLSDANKIGAAKRAAASSSNEVLASGVHAFILDGTEDLDQNGATVTLQVKVGDCFKSWNIPVNAELIKYNQDPDGYSNPNTEPSEEPSAEATNTPTPKPTNTPTPVPAETPDIASMTRTTLRNNGNGPFNVEDLKDYVDGGYVIITATRNSVKDSVVAGWGIGGLGFSTDDWAIEAGTKFEVTVEESMLVAEGETIEVVYTAKEIYDYAVDKGTDEVIVNFYNGYVTTTVDVAK